ncbi:hypothetical protein D3H64_06240 [Atopobacter sp. AH10]|nr:hypothetical protein D3H64_06240 [Atopobacter sp. AH10]
MCLSLYLVVGECKRWLNKKKQSDRTGGKSPSSGAASKEVKRITCCDERLTASLNEFLCEVRALETYVRNEVELRLTTWETKARQLMGLFLL